MLGSTLCVVYSTGLHKCILSCIHRSSVMPFKSAFHTLLPLCPSFALSLPSPVRRSSHLSGLLGAPYPWSWTVSCPSHLSIRLVSSLRPSEKAKKSRRLSLPSAWGRGLNALGTHYSLCPCLLMGRVWGFQGKCFGCS